MDESQTNGSDQASTSPTSSFAVWLIVGLSAGLTAVACWMASQFEWSLGQSYLGVMIANTIACWICVLIWNPVLVKRRMIMGSNTKKWDWLWLIVFAALIVLVGVVGVRELYRLPDDFQPSQSLWIFGIILFVFGWAFLTWSMTVNPFFEKTVRIQTDQGHHVIEDGPYAFVRHPGYVGINAILLATPALLSSYLTLAAALAAVIWLLVRTVLEDQTLQRELPGYREYAAKTPYRQIPGIW